MHETRKRWRRLVVVTLLALSLAASYAEESRASGAEPAPRWASLPGAPPMADALLGRLAQAVADRGAGYVPRTRHLEADGSPRYTNRLVLESSPYLRQHAHNPVNWYPWGEEAFAEARRLGRPVLLSIGYSTCHWCHVMEHESFEDVEVASYLNAHYVAIKVDREERPDLDEIYMSAVQMLTGRGGWPMTVWLTADREPFFGGTYFPARDGDRGTRKGFLSLLRELSEAHSSEPESLVARGREMAARIRRVLGSRRGGALPQPSQLDSAQAVWSERFDDRNGGRRGRLKFPSGLPVRFLLSRYAQTGEARLLEMAELTLEQMAAGGIRDHVGGGFHRYATDAQWRVPHFEKMLYDNAQLVLVYLDAYQVSGRRRFAAVAEDTLEYLAREMTSSAGGFYSATDADSATPDGELEEGWFFTWTPAELQQVLGAADARVVQAYYGVTPAGNLDGRNVLHVPRPAPEVARLLGLGIDRLEATLERSREKLHTARSARPRPLRDDKILASWNGLAISAMARGGFVLGRPEFIERAARAAGFLLDHCRRDGRLQRTCPAGPEEKPAFLDDYAFLVAGLIELYEATADARWLREALALQRILDERYLDGEKGGYFLTADDHEALLARQKPMHDGAEPSGNSVALMNLLRLHELTTDDRFRATAQRLLEGFGGALRSSTASMSEMLLAVEFWLETPKEIVLVADGPCASLEPFLEVLRDSYLPHTVRVALCEGQPDRAANDALVPWVRGKIARAGRPTAYVCERGVCSRPATQVEVFTRLLHEVPGSSVGSAPPP